MEYIDGREDVIMAEFIDIYSYMVWGDYNKRINELASIALDETWSFANKSDNSILKNYLKYTFYKLQEENKILETDKYCVFNTGLFNTYYSPIYVQGVKDTSVEQGWKFKCFCTEFELLHIEIFDFPQRADYFSGSNSLVFDWHYEIKVNYRHILEDEENRKRLPEVVLNSDKPERELKGAIEESINRVMANYKLAVPQYFNGKIQLLLPLYFGKENRPYLALTLTKVENGNTGYYLAYTCLTMDMAYNNARLIAKPESNWLLPQNID